ncbi:MCE family protein [Mycolicibacillus parakoreensis]|uniref:MCE family protein n=1 Tax=Mycolicibacillus parakoreensis TaxID=1069221 RepID=A0ABY3TZU1_9MYCO|nr:MCE family protein [Mycolicibacillus parakoreensis]MCV7317092.1 MCE family protein [Mycolicibacillus parakoreensis]ULN51416.1 MCE family protein [Mycolicibacillus parakoreensis]
MTTRKPLRVAVGALLAVLLLVGGVFVVRQTVLKPTTITAYFSTATAIYPGDEVRVSGVKVGTIDRIEPQGPQTKLTLRVDRTVPVPADAKAVIVAPNLVAARFVQLTPAYHHGDGPTLPDGAVIPRERTAVPVEWDEVKTQLNRLAAELGPRSGVSGTSASRFLESAASAMDGNGAKLRETLAQMSGVARILAEGSGDIVDIIEGLQTFVTALRDSDQQIVAFESRLATLTSVVDDSRTNLDAALRDFSNTVDEVRDFVAGSHAETVEVVDGLSQVSQTLADAKDAVRNILHITPNAIANTLNMYNASSGTPLGSFGFINMANPVQAICTMTGAIGNVTSTETGKLCEQYLGPALRLLNFNGLPLPINPYLAKSGSPDKLIYTDPALMPNAERPPDPAEPELPISAYTGLDGDVAPPPGWDDPASPPGSYAPDGLPAAPTPPLYAGAPPPSPTTFDGMLLPGGPPPGPVPGPPPAEGEPSP